MTESAPLKSAVVAPVIRTRREPKESPLVPTLLDRPTERNRSNDLLDTTISKLAGMLCALPSSTDVDDDRGELADGSSSSTEESDEEEDEEEDEDGEEEEEEGEEGEVEKVDNETNDDEEGSLRIVESDDECQVIDDTGKTICVNFYHPVGGYTSYENARNTKFKLVPVEN